MKACTPIHAISAAARALRLAAGCLAAILTVTSLASAQTLGDIAAREEARRKKVTRPSPAYTNKDIKPSDRPEPVSPAQTSSDTATPAGSGEAQGAADGEGEPAAGQAEAPLTDDEEGVTLEEQWRTRIAEARAALDRSQMFAEALQSRINALWADFTARDDPAQRSVIEAERRKALAQLDRVKAEIVTQTKAIADIEEEARRAGIPPGWLR